MKAVLDTNVWLDWLVFTDASVTTIARGVQAGVLQVLGSDATRAEWLEVIARRRFGMDEETHARAVAAYDRILCRRAAAPACGLLCRDPDDQKFLDLAIAERADWLITRDKALLSLARRAAHGHALAIARPDAPALHAALSGCIAHL